MAVDHELALERLDTSLMEKHVCVECAVTPRLQWNTHIQLSTRESTQHFIARGVLLLVHMLVVKSKYRARNQLELGAHSSLEFSCFDCQIYAVNGENIAAFYCYVTLVKGVQPYIAATAVAYVKYNCHNIIVYLAHFNQTKVIPKMHFICLT